MVMAKASATSGPTGSISVRDHAVPVNAGQTPSRTGWSATRWRRSNWNRGEVPPAGWSSATAPLFAGALTVILAVAIVATPKVGPGAGMLAAAVVTGLGAFGVCNPVAAVVFVLVCSFMRLTPEFAALPLQPFAVAFAGMIAAICLGVWRRTLPMPRPGTVELMMLLYVVWNVFSIVTPHTYSAIDTSTNQELSVRRLVETGTLIPFAFFVVGRFVFARHRALRQLLWSILGLTAYSTAVSILQFTGPTALVWPRFIVTSPAWVGRAVGVFNQPVINGFVLIVGFIVALFLASRADASGLTKLLAYMVAAPTLIAVYLTHTRAVWLALVLVLTLGALLSRRLRPAMVITMSLIVITVMTNWSTFASSDRAAGGVTSASEAEDRLNIMATSVWAIWQKPFMGWGIGRFQELNTFHHQQWSPEVPWLRGLGLASHENELGIGAELGVIGLALWLAVIVTIIWLLLRAVRGSRPDEVEGPDLPVVGVLVMTVWVIIGTTVDIRYFELGNAIALLLAAIAIGVEDRRRSAGPRGSGVSGTAAATACCTSPATPAVNVPTQLRLSAGSREMRV